MFIKILKGIWSLFAHMNALLTVIAFGVYIFSYQFFGSTIIGYFTTITGCLILAAISYLLAIRSSDKANLYNSAEDLIEDNNGDLFSILFCFIILALWLFLLGYPDIEIFDSFYYVIMLLFFIAMVAIAMIENSRTVMLGAHQLKRSNPITLE